MKRAIFYGWWIVVASGLIQLISVGIGVYTPPVFLVPLQEHFGWSRAAIAASTSIAALTVGVASPLVGIGIDRFGPRRVMTLGALLMGAGSLLFALMGSLWQLYAISVVGGLGVACAAWIPNQTLISNWFIRKRGLAMGISLAGIGIGGLLMAPLAYLLIDRFGWRLAYVGLACITLAGVITVVQIAVRTRPADLGLLPDGDDSGPDDDEISLGGAEAGESAGLDLRGSLRTSVFWLLSLVNLLMIFASFSVIAHFVALLRDAGFESQTAAASLGVLIGVSVGGRLLFGFAADRFSKAHVMSFALALLALGTLFLFRIQAPGALPIFLMTFGPAFGGASVLLPLLVGELFGLRALGKVLGLVMISATLGAAVGPILTGHIFDVSGSYRTAFMLHVAAFVTAAVLVRFLRRPA